MAALSSGIRAPGSIPNFTGHVQGIRGQIRDPMPVSPRMAAMSRPPMLMPMEAPMPHAKLIHRWRARRGSVPITIRTAAGRNSRNETTSGITGFTQMQSVSTAVKVQAVRQNSRSENFPI